MVRPGIRELPPDGTFVLPRGSTNLLLAKLGSEEGAFLEPETREGWHMAGLRCMSALADLGAAQMGHEDSRYDGTYQTVRVPNCAIATVEYTEGRGSDDMGLDEAHRMVKVQPTVRLIMPAPQYLARLTPRAQMAHLGAIHERYQEQRRNQPEYCWESPTAHQITVLFGSSYSNNRQVRLDQLPDEQLKEAVGTLQAVAIAAALEVGDYRLVESLTRVWGSDE